MSNIISNIRQITKDYLAKASDRLKAKQALESSQNEELKKLVNNAKKNLSTLITGEVKFALERGHIHHDLDVRILNLPAHIATSEFNSHKKIEKDFAYNPILQELVTFIKAEGLGVKVYASDGYHRPVNKQPWGYIEAVVPKDLLQ